MSHNDDAFSCARALTPNDGVIFIDEVKKSSRQFDKEKKKSNETKPKEATRNPNWFEWKRKDERAKKSVA